MNHTAIFDASIANGSVLLQVAAVADPLVSASGNGFLVPTLSKLMRVAAVGTNLTRVQLTSGTLREYAPFDVNPVNVGTAIETPARILDFKDSPVDLEVNEELDAFGVQSNAGAQRIRVIVWFCDGPVRPIKGRFFSMHWTASTTLTANAWSAVTPVFDNGLPAGTFLIVGARCISAGALVARFIPRGGSNPWRPGFLCVQAQDGAGFDDQRFGASGEFLRFTNTTPPQVEIFSGSADTSEEGYIDMMQVG